MHAQNLSSQFRVLSSVPVDCHPLEAKEPVKPETKAKGFHLSSLTALTGICGIWELPNLHNYLTKHKFTKQLPHVMLRTSYHHSASLMLNCWPNCQAATTFSRGADSQEAMSLVWLVGILQGPSKLWDPGFLGNSRSGSHLP